MYCSLCKDESEEESEIHLLKCSVIRREINMDISHAKYENIFSDNIEDQVSITKVYNQVIKTRKNLIHKK